MQFELVQNVKIVFGAGKLSELGELVKLENSSRPLVVTDKGIVAAGERAAMFYCIQRPDACCFGPADMIDPAYAAGLRDAVAHGVEVYPHLAVLTVEGIGLEADYLTMV